ncbi:MAG TPA: response regulator [Polyangiales bacterium]|nr:response regulator [Polyangiales bacterium]
MTDGPLLLLIEDEAQMRRFLRASLGSHGFRLLEAGTAREGMALATSHNPDVILLDLGLPDGDGIEITRALRGWSKVPILVLSARGREDDKVLALDAGADDYVTKPFGMNELLARVRVALRHAAQVEPSQPTLDLGDGLQIDLERRQVRVQEREVHLTPIEYKLLTTLARHADKVLTHRQLLKEVWGPNSSEQTHYLRVRMAELRKKIEATPARPRWLLTEPGVGYRLRGAV